MTARGELLDTATRIVRAERQRRWREHRAQARRRAELAEALAAADGYRGGWQARKAGAS